MTQNDVALRRQGISDRSYFAWTTGAVALVVLAGFARTYTSA